MRWVLRLLVAVALSAGFVAMLTAVAWPRPRFVVEFPLLPDGQYWKHEPDEYDRSKSGDSNVPRHRYPWLGFETFERDPQTGWPIHQQYWFVNLADGRTAGPIPAAAELPNDWDHRGAAVVGGVVPADGPGLHAVGRIDPETLAYAKIAGDRGQPFLVSQRGETLVTSAPSRPVSHWGRDIPASDDEDFVCYDLTADPPHPQRMAIVVPVPGRPHAHPVAEVRDAFGGVAVSPDGRTLAVSDLRRGAAQPWGITLLDTRTGQALRRFTDLGPPLPPERRLGPDNIGPEDLHFTNDSRYLKFVLSHNPVSWTSTLSMLSNRIDLVGPGRLRVIDLETGSLATPPDYYDRNGMPQSPDGSRRLASQTPVNPPGFFGSFPPDMVSPRAVDPAGEALGPPIDLGGAAKAVRCGPSQGALVTGTTGLAAALYPGPSPPRWVERVRGWMRLPPRPTAGELVWVDWETGRRQRLADLSVGEVNGSGTLFPDLFDAIYVGPKVFARVHKRTHGVLDYVEIWDAPPPRRPWAWSVPAGVAMGLMVTAGGRRLLGRRRTGGASDSMARG